MGSVVFPRPSIKASSALAKGNILLSSAGSGMESRVYRTWRAPEIAVVRLGGGYASFGSWLSGLGEGCGGSVWWGDGGT